MQNGEYTELKAFCAVAEAGRFSTAAKRLQISASALSQIIRRLEDRLDVRLFNRTTRSVALTEDGERFFQQIRPALGSLEAAFHELKAQSGTLSGIVRIHATHMAADTILTPFIGQFHQHYPDIVLDVVAEDSIIDITAAGFDCGIALGEFVQQDMIAYPLGPELRMTAAASPDYLAKHGTPQTPADLQHHQCLNWRHMAEKSIYRWEFFQDDHWISVAVNGPLITTRRELALTAALQHIGIVFWTEDKLQPWLDSGELVPLLQDFCPPFLGWHLYYPRHRHSSSALRALIEALRQFYPRPSSLSESR
ncbi:HTH-type transcriptional regulator DmlR [Vibrio aerogenes CECT 7868]|uniref:HTH-type transcriptional regulator DmlR n=1 Tax=Vibrio aerogenes CECT 7868 TaxID=1216006 RepID=A0A1M5ZXT5_9VIBR|nr:LysR family transcriptional regulator [Vibrio aerogenes]SHI29095.1 HTH-type transcriptional regulator DmlR [Vibrio aerogenes CECT 7868]